MDEKEKKKRKPNKMNIKLHTPQSLKTGSGMASMKQFLLSLLATTVSIALTFGTAAIIDYNKKQREKREIVMMVLYDMYNTLQSVERVDSMIHQAMDYQLQIAEDTTKLDKLKFHLAQLAPYVDYTETTEHIFSSSIESINTVGSVLFTENVAKFYHHRKTYKAAVCDSLTNSFSRNETIRHLKSILDFEYYYFAIISSSTLLEMQQTYAQCKQMMKVSDEQIKAYEKQKLKMDKSMSDIKAEDDSIMNEVMKKQKRIDDARENYMVPK